MSRALVMVAFFVFVACVSPAVAGDQQRDRPAAAVTPAKVTGTAVVAGVVTLADSSETFVRRAVVTLASSDGVTVQSVVADETGRFAFAELPDGSYTLSAKKAAHLTNSYGAKRPGRPGTTLVVAPGQQVTGLRLPLPRGAVITGTLRLPGGEPMINTPVVTIPIALATAGGRTMSSTGFATDDLGVYRIHGLAPGEYLVAALPAVGRGDVEQRTEREYEAAIRALTQAAGRGGEAGATGANAAAAVPPPATAGYAPTYYPGTSAASNAIAVKVAAGDVKDGIDIPITMVRMGSVSGTVLGVDGRPTRAVQINADPVGPPLPFGGATSFGSTRPDEQGRFSLTNLPPGAYRLTARGGGITFTGDSVTIRSEEQTQWAVADLQVNETDVSGITLTLQAGMTFAGRVVADGAGKPPETWKGARVAIQPARQVMAAVMLNGSPMSGLASRSAAASDDGTFHVTGIQPGDYEISVVLPSAIARDWAVRSITAGGRDLRDVPLTFAGGSMGDVVMTLTDQRTSITGTLSSAGGTPASDYYVVIFAAERSLWHATSPRVRLVRPRGDGLFTTRDLPAGSYRMAALTDVEDDEWRRPAFLESLMDASILLTLADGEAKRQDIRIR